MHRTQTDRRQAAEATAIASRELRELYRGLLLVRRAEERLGALFSGGEVAGVIHLSIGQEAVAVGVMSALDCDDTIVSTHRGHGHAIAKGVPLDRFFAELLGRDEGLCRGRGGSMHVADMGLGMLGANGIVGAGLSIALGSALAHKTLGRPAVAVAFFGDGALAEGLLHECFNLARLWRLPLLFVCENNGWGEFRPTDQQVAFKLGDLAAAFGLPHTAVDGNDVTAVAAAAREAVAAVREGAGPAVIECLTTRVRGHYEGDPQRYRDPVALAAVAENDPLRRAAARLVEAGVAEAELAGLAAEAEALIEAAVAAARRGGEPSFAAALADVYTPAEQA